ncbi:lysoplasmalogenase TMEM86B-like isoform X2 [Asterias amurensis]|uniref:lysoplasmalogenase TMEM86B-like isoform X2 n=2 Tax=Asterias amurensis TaxID=7602 RepID=UPI003AB3EBDA
MGITGLLRSDFLLLCPCVMSSLLYLLHWIPQENEPSPLGIFLKCLPIVFLCLYVLIQIHHYGFSRYSLAILLGLLFSGVGDACLVYAKDYFIFGLASFAVAHLLYIVAFHERPMWWTFMFFYLPYYIVMWQYIVPGVSAKLFYPGMVYGVLILTMLWRAMARITISNKTSWTRLYAFFGAALFLVSDTVLSVNLFADPVPHAQYIIMTTYYLAQLLIAVSVVKELGQTEKLDNMLPSDKLKSL